MRQRRVISQILVSILAGAFLLSVACAPKAAPAPTPTPAPPSPVATPAVAPAAPTPARETTPTPTPKPASAKPAWEVQWGGLVDAARKEGTVVFGTTAGSEAARGLADGFRARHGIAVEYLALKSSALAEKLLTERRAGLYLMDVFVGGTTTAVSMLKPAKALDPLEPVLILPDVRDVKNWRWGRLDFADKDRVILAFAVYVRVPVAINTNLVKSGEIQSYNDLLNPKWKGKIVMHDPTTAGGGLSLASTVGTKIMGMDYLKELAKQEPTLTRDRRQLMEWLARGKYAIAFAPNNENFAVFKQAGAPIQYVTLKEIGYITPANGAVGLVNRAPHPNAATVFINWLLTPEAQTIWSKSQGVPSSRLDVTTDHVYSEMVPSPGKSYYADYTEEAVLEKQDVRLMEEIFGPLKR